MADRRTAPLVLLALAVAASGASGQDPATTLIGASAELYVNLTLIDGRGGEPQKEAAILVWGGRIRGAGPRSMLPVPEGTQVVDLEGAFVIPGLIDVDTAPRDGATLSSMLAAGITGVREAEMPLDRFVRNGRSVPGDDPRPDVFIGGPILEGPEGTVGTPIPDRDAIPGVVERTVEDDGAAFVSVGASVPAEWVVDIARAARAGHVPVWLEPREEDWLRAVRSGADAVAGLVPLDPESPEADALVTALLSGDAVLVPLLASGAPPPPEPSSAEPSSAGTGPEEANARRLLLARLLDDQRVRMAVGSGAPSSAASADRFHRELELLVEAGISPLRVLEMASGNGAVALGELHRRGTIEEGKRADFVVLEADPVADIRNSRRVRFVVLEGKAWKPRPEGGFERLRFR